MNTEEAINQLIKSIEEFYHPTAKRILTEELGFPETIFFDNFKADIQIPTKRNSQNGELCRYVLMQNDENCEQDEYCSVINPKGYPSITFHYSKNVTIENQRKAIYANTQISIYELKTNENNLIKNTIKLLKESVYEKIKQEKELYELPSEESVGFEYKKILKNLNFHLILESIQNVNENTVIVKSKHPGLKQTIDIVISQRKGVSIWGLICTNAKKFYESLQTIINAFHY